MSPLEISIGLKRSKCDMNEDDEACYKAFNTVAKKIGSWDLIQGFLAYNIFLTHIGWKLPKQVKSKEGELVTLAFKFQKQASFKAPSSGWLQLTQNNCDEIAGNYLTKEHKDMAEQSDECNWF